MRGLSRKLVRMVDMKQCFFVGDFDSSDAVRGDIDTSDAVRGCIDPRIPPRKHIEVLA